jgi:hypothetical protein
MYDTVFYGECQRKYCKTRAISVEYRSHRKSLGRILAEHPEARTKGGYVSNGYTNNYTG